MAIETGAVKEVYGNVTMTRDGGDLIIRVRHRSLLDALHLLIGLVLAVAAGLSTPSVLEGEGVGYIVLVVAVDLAILAFIYTSIARALNRTVLRVSDAGVEITDEPLPVPLAEEHPRRVVGVTKVAYEEYPIMILLPFYALSQRNYRLAAICWDGKHRIMLPLLSTRAEARAVKQAIEMRLNLRRDG